MPKASPRAPAHKFVVISDSAYFTSYTGTREQLIAFGIAKPEQFPEGRKRVKWDYSNLPREGWEIRKLKDGIFRLKEEHRRRGLRKEGPVYFQVELEKNAAGYTPWIISGEGLGGQLSSGYSYRSLAEAANLIVDTVKYELQQSKRKHLKLVAPVSATGGK